MSHLSQCSLGLRSVFAKRVSVSKPTGSAAWRSPDQQGKGNHTRASSHTQSGSSPEARSTPPGAMPCWRAKSPQLEPQTPARGQGWSDSGYCPRRERAGVDPD